MAKLAKETGKEKELLEAIQRVAEKWMDEVAADKKKNVWMSALTKDKEAMAKQILSIINS